MQLKRLPGNDNCGLPVLRAKVHVRALACGMLVFYSFLWAGASAFCARAVAGTHHSCPWLAFSLDPVVELRLQVRLTLFAIEVRDATTHHATFPLCLLDARSLSLKSPGTTGTEVGEGAKLTTIGLIRGSAAASSLITGASEDDPCTMDRKRAKPWSPADRE